jgi:hypothetical protein
MTKKSSTRRRTTLASVNREMQQPRLAASVRDDPKYQAALSAEIRAQKTAPPEVSRK